MAPWGGDMPAQSDDDNGAVALYWDFENIHAALCNEKEPGAYGRQDSRFKPQEPLVDIQAIVELASSFGPIAINRAYCNWQWFSRYRDALLQNAVELIQLFPPGGSAKNGADIKLCLDATEDIGRFPHIRTVVIVGGDSDFMPVSQKIKATGRTLVGIGTRSTTNRHWAKSCHEFRYYENVVEAPPVPEAVPAPQDADVAARPVDAGAAAAPQAPAVQGPDAKAGPAIDLLRRAMQLLAEKRGDPWINKAEIWPMVKRLDPTLDLKELGHQTFTGWLKTLADVVEVRPGDHDQQLRLRQP
jgi:uncharacterized LabA/DUF88 family protein